MLWRIPVLGETSRPGESEKEFRIRLSQGSRETRDQWTEALRKKYADRIASLQDRIRRAEERIEREAARAKQRKLETAVIRPKKNGIAVPCVGFVWLPFWITTDGVEVNAWE